MQGSSKTNERRALAEILRTETRSLCVPALLDWANGGGVIEGFDVADSRIAAQELTIEPSLLSEGCRISALRTKVVCCLRR